jgi:hypothetical protein
MEDGNKKKNERAIKFQRFATNQQRLRNKLTEMTTCYSIFQLSAYYMLLRTNCNDCSGLCVAAAKS